MVDYLEFGFAFFVKSCGEQLSIFCFFDFRKICETEAGQSISLLGGVSVSGSVALLFKTKSGPVLMGMTTCSSMGSGFTICHSGILNPDTTGGLANFDLKIDKKKH